MLTQTAFPPAAVPFPPIASAQSCSRTPLTDRQLECLAWISEGKSSTDIGEILSISGRTVDYHVGEICQRLNVRTRMQAVAHAVRRGWLETA
ncbi:DNA-binding CsgD family transcriptional regulator [Sphingopyxis sp. OAS728]|uniref:response regulator transcription factor n=1 Tax=Sphingopyxis sp. OAS728 TaxID=2663823 RepID=UPI00178A0CBF|nr:helix-turn-helix transcriptional regulator [Sphingopyxis sp. OAS728]MBE1527966.1 DNA-binding CsgD family transcriptional regulator [Sphingopyxis sp. OAS728]